jgi:hypothetical protein
MLNGSHNIKQNTNTKDIQLWCHVRLFHITSLPVFLHFMNVKKMYTLGPHSNLIENCYHVILVKTVITTILFITSAASCVREQKF